MKFTNFKFLLFLCLFVFSGFIQAKGEVPLSIRGSVEVIADDVIDLVDIRPGMVILDLRSTSDRSQGFIEGSVSLPHGQVNPDRLAKLVPAKTTPVLFYCQGVKDSCGVEAVQTAVQSGYRKIYWFRGGWEEWMAMKLPVVH